MPNKPKLNFRGWMVLVIAFGGFFAAWMLLLNHSSGPEPKTHWGMQELENIQNDALARVQNSVVPTDYGVSIADDMLKGKWSSDPNFMNCNFGYRCAEVDFEIPHQNFNCKWLVSYDQDTANYTDMRALSDSVCPLFKDAESPQHTDAP